MKKFYLVFLALVLLFIPTTYGIAVYQLDQPVSRLNGYTLREVFENRNIAMPDLIGKTEISSGVYRFYNNSGVTVDYNVNNGIWDINGTSTTAIFLEIIFYDIGPTYTLTVEKISGTVLGGTIAIQTNPPTVNIISIISDNGIQYHTFNAITENKLRLAIGSGRTLNNVKIKLQLEIGDTATPYQLPTFGPYNDVDLGQFSLTNEEIQMYYDLYLEAVRFENENIEASKDPGGYQNIFKSVINGVKGLIESMGGLWQWLNAPIITSDMSDYSFNIDWSWDLIGVIRQLMNSIGVLFLQVAFVVPNLAFAFMGIPIRISILSLLFSNMIFLILGWIIVKSFVI